MHFIKCVICYVVTLLTEGHGVYFIPDFIYLLAGEDLFAGLLGIGFVKIDKRHINFDLALGLFFFKAFVYVAYIRRIYVTASAAALYVVNNGFAEKCDFCALFERQRAMLVFEKHHALTGCLTREGNVFL